MKKIFLLLALLLNFVTSQSFASTSLEYFKAQNNSYYCSKGTKDVSFELCSNLGIIDESNLQDLDIFASLIPEFVSIGDQSFCVLNGLEIDISKCNKIRSFKYTDKGTFSCTYLDGVETCVETAREEIDNGIQKSFENVVTVNGKSKEDYQKDAMTGPSEDSIVSNYFKKNDGIYYCTQFDKSLPREKSFYYLPCSDIGFTSFTGMYLVSADGTTFAKRDPVFRSTETVGRWTYFSKLEELICLNKQAEEDTSCTIDYIKKLDGSYACNFDFIYLDCSQYPKYIKIDPGMRPESTGEYVVTWNSQDGSYLESSGGIERTIRYSEGNEIWTEGQPDSSLKVRVPEQSDPINTYATCKLNGQEVDCAQMAEVAKSWLSMGLWGFLIFGVLFLVGGIFWLVMLIHAISNPIPNKTVWIIVIFFGSLLGAIVYYFVIKKRYTVLLVPPVPTVSMQNNTTTVYPDTAMPISQIVQSPIPMATTTLESVMPIVQPTIVASTEAINIPPNA